MSTDLSPLRARIAALVESGPIRAVTARQILRGEGWTNDQVREQRERLVRVAGRGTSAIWHRRRCLAAKVRPASRPAVEAAPPAPLAFPARPAARVGRCGPHGHTTANRVDGQWACLLCVAQNEGCSPERPGTSARLVD